MAAAAPSPNEFLQQRMMADTTISGGPAARGAPGESAGLESYAPAPIPDIDQDAPTARAGDPAAPRLAPKLFQKQSQYAGEGYVPGSTSQEEVYRKSGPTPGINLIMPLQ